jgi:hypothetical protein
MAIPRQERHTMLYAVLFSPTARVYNLRFLLVVTVATLVCFVKQLQWFGAYTQSEYQSGPWLPRSTVGGTVGIVSCGVITVHQVIRYVLLMFA